MMGDDGDVSGLHTNARRPPSFKRKPARSLACITRASDDATEAAAAK